MTLHCFLSQCAVLYYVVLFDVVPLYIILSSVISSSHFLVLYDAVLCYLTLSSTFLCCRKLITLYSLMISYIILHYLMS